MDDDLHVAQQPSRKSIECDGKQLAFGVAGEFDMPTTFDNVGMFERLLCPLLLAHMHSRLSKLPACAKKIRPSLILASKRL
jgi:hypothetical protein